MERIQYLVPILGNTRNNFVDVSTEAPFPVQIISGSISATGAATEAKQDELQGVQGTGASYDPPTGGSGLFGWLSGIFKEIVGGIKLKLGGAEVSSSNPLPVQNVSASPVDRSSTITAGGTAQVLLAANANRKGIEFFNNSVGSLWLNVVGTATAGGGSIEVRSGGYWSPSVCPVTAISVIGATTGQAFTCWEYA